MTEYRLLQSFIYTLVEASLPGWPNNGVYAGLFDSLFLQCYVQKSQLANEQSVPGNSLTSRVLDFLSSGLMELLIYFYLVLSSQEKSIIQEVEKFRSLPLSRFPTSKCSLPQELPTKKLIYIYLSLARKT